MSTIDIILPTYNQSSFLDTAIGVILNQHFKDFKFIIVNDGSTDATSDKLKSLKDDRLLVIDNKNNRGLPSALNIGHAAGNSPYCTWISTDNVYYPDYLSGLYDCLLQNKCDFVQSKYFVINRGEKKSVDIRNIKDNWGMSTIGASFLYKRCVWEQYKYDESLQNVEDLKFYLQAYLHGYSFAFLDRHLVDYYCHDASMTAKVHKNLDKHQLLMDEIYRTVILPHRNIS